MKKVKLESGESAAPPKPPEICYCPDGFGGIKGTHKAAPGKYDGQPITSCVWCGKTLTGERGDN